MSMGCAVSSPVAICCDEAAVSQRGTERGPVLNWRCVSPLSFYPYAHVQPAGRRDGL